MINRIEEVQCMIAAIQHCHDRNADHPTRFQKNLSWFEYVAQMAESMAAELVVAKALGYDYQPGITWDKSKADVGKHIEVKWSANPWIISGSHTISPPASPAELKMIIAGKIWVKT